MRNFSLHKFLALLLMAVSSATLSVAQNVAKIGETEYATLQEAITAAKAGQTVTLIGDVNLITEKGVTITKEITLDINGYSILCANATTKNIKVKTSGKLTLKDTKENSTGKIYAETPYVYGTYDKPLIYVDGNGEFVMESGCIYSVIPDDTSNKGQFGIGALGSSKITINGGTVESGWYAIAGNGSETTSTTITVNGGKLISTADYAIYHPQPGTLTINDGAVVYGAAGAIAMKKGNLMVNGGTLTSKGIGNTGNWGDGTGNLKSAALNFCEPYGDVTATIKGGTITAEGDAVLIDAKPVEGKTVTLDIKGGTFSSDVTALLDENSVAQKNEDGFYVVTTYYAQVGNNKYTTLQEAADAATAGQTVTLLNDVDMTSGNNLIVKAGKDIVLDMNGKSIKGANADYKNILVWGKLTLKDSKENSTGKIYAETPYKYGSYDKTLVYVAGSGEFVMESGYIYSVIPEKTVDNGQFGIGAFGSSKVTINGGTIECGWSAIAGNGSETTPTTITVNGGTLISTSDYAIYHPQSGTLTINDGAVIYGAAGAIAMRRGNLVVNGGTLTSKGVGDTGTWGNGTGNLGSAALNFCKPYGDVTATIKGGTITAEGDAVLIDAKPVEGKTVTLAIEGGTFSSDVSEYCVDGKTATPNADGTYGISEVDGVMIVYDKNYENVAAGATVKIDMDQVNKILVAETGAAGVNTTLTKNYTNTGWNSFCVPFDLTLTDEMLNNFEFATLYATTLENGTGSPIIAYLMKKAGDKITAYFPCLIKAKATGAQTLVVGEVDYKSMKGVKSQDCSSTTELFTFHPVMENTYIAAKKGYYLNSEQNSFAYNDNPEAYLPPLRYYMTIQDRGTMSYLEPTNGGVSRAKFCVIGETTGITDIVDDAANASGKVYNLQGVVVGNTTEGLPKGVYIKNGRKVIVK